MIIGEILGVEKTLSLLESLKGGYAPVMQKAVERLAIMLRDYVKENELSGQALHVRTGRLRRSITSKVTSGAGQFTGIVGTNVVYAKIQEFGGQTKPHEIRPRNAKALLFAARGFIGPAENTKTQGGRYAKGKMGRLQRAIGAGEMQFATVVHHPGSKIPSRSFLRAALSTLTPAIRVGLEDAIRGVGK
jgi:phage gpG-like protein